MRQLLYPWPVVAVLLFLAPHHALGNDASSAGITNLIDRAFGEALHARGYQVVGLRLPGHGTSPSGLRTISVPDMAAAVGLPSITSRGVK